MLKKKLKKSEKNQKIKETNNIPKLYFGMVNNTEITIRSRKKMIKQLKKRGFDDSELWNLDVTLVSLFLPRLKRFAKMTQSYPPNLSPKRWNKILNRIIRGGELYLDTDYISMLSGEKLIEIQKQMAISYGLLGRYFTHLWD